MCLVQVEKAPKPLPACATPVTDGMKVHTHSDYAVNAQKGVMEFLLINHPLDCPICDQGGECQLQDLAVGYGGSDSRYEEEKRVVDQQKSRPADFAHDMTRCIHCTRCVRFGQEIAGVMELGMIGRGEHAEIIGFRRQNRGFGIVRQHDRLVPSRRAYLEAVPLLRAHLGIVALAIGQPALRPRLQSDRASKTKSSVMRVVPRENEAINECWLVGQRSLLL